MVFYIHHGMDSLRGYPERAVRAYSRDRPAFGLQIYNDTSGADVLTIDTKKI